MLTTAKAPMTLLTSKRAPSVLVLLAVVGLAEATTYITLALHERVKMSDTIAPGEEFTLEDHSASPDAPRARSRRTRRTDRCRRPNRWAPRP